MKLDLAEIFERISQRNYLRFFLEACNLISEGQKFDFKIADKNCQNSMYISEEQFT